MGSRYRCRVSPSGVPGCLGAGTGGSGGSGSGDVGPTGPTGPSSDEPDLESPVTTEEDETVVALEIPIGENELASIGVKWIGSDALSNVVIHEATFALKRVGAAATTEVGIHDNGTVRNVVEVVGAATDYVPTATGVDLTVQGAVGTPMNWIVQAWFSLYPIG